MDGDDIMIKTVAAEISGARRLRPTKGEQVLVHDGKRIIVQHGPEAKTYCGNPAYVMVRGTKKEIEAEIARLKLTGTDEYVKPVVEVTKL